MMELAPSFLLVSSHFRLTKFLTQLYAFFWPLLSSNSKSFSFLLDICTLAYFYRAVRLSIWHARIDTKSSTARILTEVRSYMFT